MPDEEQQDSPLSLDRRVRIDLKSWLIGALMGVVAAPVVLSMLIRFFPSLNFLEEQMVQQVCGDIGAAVQACILDQAQKSAELEQRIAALEAQNDKLEFEICVLRHGIENCNDA